MTKELAQYLRVLFEIKKQKLFSKLINYTERTKHKDADFLIYCSEFSIPLLGQMSIHGL